MRPEPGLLIALVYWHLLWISGIDVTHRLWQSWVNIVVFATTVFQKNKCDQENTCLKGLEGIYSRKVSKHRIPLLLKACDLIIERVVRLKQKTMGFHHSTHPLRMITML